MATTTRTLTHTVINSDVNINNDNKSDNNKNNKDTEYHNFNLDVEFLPKPFLNSATCSHDKVD